ncbi:MAG TPA: efflux transporter outer membrane subunit, partial [Bryobacteraceae bacterium]|nr:efflux transporter outer membrane subunit [Bryobacteraceae bacterium]
MQRKSILLAMACFLCGCVHPGKYDRPAVPVPNAWPATATSEPSAQGASAAATTKWQEYFSDAKLQSVIELALANNRDLRMSALNIEKAQAYYRIQRAKQFPTVAASASGDAYRLPVNMSGKDEAETVAQFTVGLGVAAWEVDLFGRIRGLKSQALEQYLATEQARSATQIALVAAVANSYLALGGDRENLRLAQATLEAQQASYELIKRIRDAGIASDLELAQARSQVEAARADIALFTGQVALDENALNLLAGAPVAADLLPGELGSDRALKDIAAGLPSEVLLRRPDILMAEHQLKAAYANIDTARAAFFPRISLTAATGLVSSDLVDLFKTGSGTWQFAPEVTLPIFDMGARRANLKVAQVDRDLAVASYEKSIQSAFREVSDSLTVRARLLERLNAQEALVKSLEETY